MTYKELKIDVLQKIGDSRNVQNGNIINNTSTNNYISQMPNLLREALNIVSTSGRYIVKYIDIVNNPIRSGLYENMREIYSITEDMEVKLDKAKAYYFEMFGKGTVELYVDGVLVNTFINSSTSTFTVYKGKITNPLEKQVKMVFKAQYPYSVRNIALYTVEFESDEDVYDNIDFKRYDLRELVNDFYNLKVNDMPYEAGIDIISYQNNSEYHWEGDSVLVLDNNKKGIWRIYYNSYPQDIPSDISDDTEIEVLPEVASIIPFYIAGQLLMSEDEDYSTERLNEFEARRAELIRVKEQPSSYNTEFENTTGW
jgi:hypothetical protein